MNPTENEFRGFEKIAAKKSTNINKLLCAVIFSAEACINAFTSTPNSKRNHSKMSFTKFCEDALKSDSNLQIMDYDSGYHQESNSDSSLENVNEGSTINYLSKPIYLSEDALLEKPNINIKNLDLSAEIDKEDFEETHRLFNSSEEEVINPSVPSVETAFSGISNESGDSDISVDIPIVDRIVFTDNKECTDDSANCTLNDTDDNELSSSHVDIEEIDRSNVNNTLDISEVDVSECISNVKLELDPISEQPECDFESSKINVINENVSANIVQNNVPVTSVLNNVTNLNFPSSEVISKYFSSFADEDKENTFVSKTPKKYFKNSVEPKFSPDIFDEEPAILVKEEVPPSDFVAEEKYILKKDVKLLKRVQTGLSGVLPPPSVTILNFSVTEMLNKIENNKQYFWTNDIKKIDGHEARTLDISDNSNCGDSKSLLVTTCATDFTRKPWPVILEDRYHGVHFNRSKISEEFELLCDKFAQRCVGAETQSTCTVFENASASPTKRKIQKNRWAVKSPGRRLSHLARRRITFSSANLQAGGPSMAGTRARQMIMLDAKKSDFPSRRRSPKKSPRKTPKKTPSKSPRIKTRTPSSSAKKKLAMRFRIVADEFEKTVPSTSSENLLMTSKRALFQSPSKCEKKFLPSTSGLSIFQKDIKKGPPKRALFISPHKSSPKRKSPLKHSPSKLGFDKKRKRTDSDDINPAKLPRSMSMDIRPSESEKCKTLIRSRSDLNVSRSSQSGELSDMHKKKLQWAVYEALRSQNITPTHAQFKLFASILARVTRRFFLSGSGARPEGGTSERMLRIARHHVYAVIKGKSVDEIVNEYLKNRSKLQKPQGYVGLEEFNRLQTFNTAPNKENVLRDRGNTVGSADKRKLEQLGKPKSGENKVDRIRKVINFGDDDVRWKTTH